MNVFIRPGLLGGRIASVASKSDAHRLLLCAALADRPTLVCGLTDSQDIRATVSCLQSIGTRIDACGEDVLQVTPLRRPAGPARLFCGESGSTLRFLLPVAGIVGQKTSFSGAGRLPSRPMGALVDQMKAHGCVFSGDTLPFTVSGGLRGGRYCLPGNVSSQFVSGLLFALPLAEQDSQIVLTTPLESAAYVDMTLGALARFGIAVQPTREGYFIPGRQSYRSPGRVQVEGDWSCAAFFLVAGALGAPVSVCGLSLASRQSDRAILDILRHAGAGVQEGEGEVRVSPGPLSPFQADVSAFPDLFPILSVLACACKGKSVLSGAARLRLKESDRIQAMAQTIACLGGRVEQQDDRLIVCGTGALVGGQADGFGDHRVVMSAAVASILCKQAVTITGAQAADKSYPRFWEDFTRLGGNSDVL